jgi:hypothetical protein
LTMRHMLMMSPTDPKLIGIPGGLGDNLTDT